MSALTQFLVEVGEINDKGIFAHAGQGKQEIGAVQPAYFILDLHGGPIRLYWHSFCRFHGADCFGSPAGTPKRSAPRQEHASTANQFVGRLACEICALEVSNL